LAKKPRKRGAYLFRKFDCEPAPLMLGFVLGPMLEENFRRALVLADGDFSVFFTRPISLSLLILAVVLIRDRHAAFYQEEARRVAVED
jgi:TctA family transporter